MLHVSKERRGESPREHVQWTCDSDERREPKRAAGPPPGHPVGLDGRLRAGHGESGMTWFKIAANKGGMGMTLSRRDFVGSAAMAPLLLGMATKAGAQAVNPDPYSYVDPELAVALRKFPAGDGISAQNLAATRAGDKNYSMSDAPELQPRKATVPGPGGE